MPPCQREPIVNIVGILTTMIAVCVAVAAQTDIGLWRSNTRVGIPLGGQWQCSLDGGRSWRSVALPYVELDPPKRMLYRKTLYLDSNALKRGWQLSFDGVRDAVEVTINGQYIGRLFSGQVPIVVTLPSRVLHAGHNTIELAAVPSSDEALLQYRMQWRSPWRPIGIVRPISLVGSTPVFIEHATIEQHTAADRAHIRVTAYVACQQQGAQRAMSVRATILRGGATVATAATPLVPIVDRQLPVTVELDVASPQHWSPQSPELYDLRVELIADGAVTDDLSRSIAFRRIEPASGSGRVLVLDGVPLSLRGVVYVDQWMRNDDGTLRPPDYERDVRLLQQLGVNVVYCAWLPPSPRFVELCSHAGILVLLDVPFGDIPARYFSQEELPARAQNMAIRLRDAYAGAPSVVGCVLASNLDYGSAAVREYVGAIGALVRQQQWLRVVSVPAGHTLPEGLPSDAVLVSDDILAHGRRHEQKQYFERTIGSLRQPWMLVGGSLVQPWNRNGYADPLSVEGQAEYVSQLYRLATELGSAGIVIRTLNDYMSVYPVLTTNAGEQGLCSEGLVNLSRQHRLAFELVRALNTGETAPLLQPGSYDPGTPYVLLGGGLGGVLLVFWLLNRSRRFRQYVLRSLIHPHNFFTDVRDQRILMQGQTLLLALAIALTYALVLGTLFYVTRHDPAADYLSNLLTLSPQGKALYIQLAWSPELAVTVVLLVVLVKIVALALVLRGIAALTDRTVLFADALTMVVWSLIPIVLFLPLAAVLFRLLTMTPPILWFAVLGVVTIWSIARLLRAVTIVFEAPPLLVYSIGVGSIAAVGGIVLGILQLQTALVTYLGHFVTLFFP